MGAYWYSYADSVKRAEEEARTCLKVLEGKNLTCPFSSTKNMKIHLALNGKTRTDIILKFLEIIRPQAAKCGLYSSTNFITTKLQASRLRQYPLWIAEYGSKLHYPGTVWAWQYTSTGRVSGIKGHVDCNHGYFAQQQNTSDGLLRKGDTGAAIKLLQHRLNLVGSQLTVDGIWGVQTDRRRAELPVPSWPDGGRYRWPQDPGGTHSGRHFDPGGGAGEVPGQAQVALSG